MRIRLVTVAILLLAVAACGDKPPPKPDPTVVVPPTPQEVAQTIIADGFFDLATPPRGKRLTTTRAQHVKKTASSAFRTHGSTPEGKEALDIVARQIDSQVSGALQNELWDFVILYCEAYEALKPGSPRYTTTKAEAEIELRKPVLSKLQIITDIDSGLTTILVDVLMPFEGVVFENQRLYVGDEYPNLRLKVVAVLNGKAIRVQYLETGDEWVVERK